MAPAISGVFIYYVNDRISDLQIATIVNQNKKIIGLSKDINAVTARASDLEIRLQASERGIASFYEFNGVYVQKIGKVNKSVSGPETTAFKEIIKLYNDKNWILLRQICSEEIVKAPLWLSPYLFSGIASANLGNLEDAENKLKYVVEKSGGDPNYADASRLLIIIKIQKND